MFGWAYALWQVAQFRELTLEQSQRHLLSISISLAQHLDAMFNDGVGAAATAVRLADDQTPDLIADSRLGELFAASLGGGEYVQALFAYADGEYRQGGRAGGGTLTPPPAWVAKIDAEPKASAWAGNLIEDCGSIGCLPVARKVATRSGRRVWAGAIFDVASIQALHERLRLHQGAIGLVAEQGYMIARVPAAPQRSRIFNERVASGAQSVERARWLQSRELVGPLTGVPMIYQISRVNGLPLAVAVGMPKSEALISWKRQATITLGLLVAATAMLAALGWQLRRSLMRMEAGESQVRMLLDASPLGILLTDGQVVLEANRAAHELLGVPAGTKLDGMPVMQFAPQVQPDGAPSEQLHREVLASLSRGGQVKFLSAVRRFDTDALLPIEVSLSTQRFGTSSYILAIVRDLTDLERANEQLALLNANLENRVEARTEELRVANAGLLAMNRELEAFASSVSHDLRAPLTTISAMAAILREELRNGSGSSAERRLDRIQHATHRMTEIIEGLLTLAGMTTQSLRWEEVSLTALAAQVAQDLRQQYPDSGIEFHCDAMPNVRADPRLMRTLLGNLLSNAWKYSMHTSQPRVQFRQQSSAAHDVEYVVSDNGAGFAMEHAEQLFQPFHRMHAHSEYPGVGLGLAIAQRVVHRYGGHIWAHSEPGRGAVFHFTLPAAHKAECEEDIRHAG